MWVLSSKKYTGSKTYLNCPKNSQNNLIFLFFIFFKQKTIFLFCFCSFLRHLLFEDSSFGSKARRRDLTSNKSTKNPLSPQSGHFCAFFHHFFTFWYKFAIWTYLGGKANPGTLIPQVKFSLLFPRQGGQLTGCLCSINKIKWRQTGIEKLIFVS